MKCCTCELEFNSVSTLASHVRWHHKRCLSQRICSLCGKTFEAPNFKQHERKCARVKPCDMCQTLTRNNHFCSKSCAASKNNADGKIGYTKYRLNKSITKKRTYHDICSEHWPEACAICGWNISIDVHHIDSNHANDDIKNLIPLCQNHHMMTRMKEHAEIMRDQILVLVKAKFTP